MRNTLIAHSDTQKDLFRLLFWQRVRNSGICPSVRL